MWEVIKEAKEEVVLNQPVLIAGLPGIGNVGKISVDFLVEELKFKKLYSFFSYRFPHSVFVNEDNLIEMPKLEIYYKKFNNKARSDLLILCGDIQPIDEESCYSFCEEVLKLAKKQGCNEIVTAGGIGLAKVPEKPKIYCTGNDKSLIQKYIKKGVFVEKNIYGVVGPVMGVSGLLVGLGGLRKVKGVTLLAETFGHPMYLGIKGAQELLKVLDKVFGWGLNLKKMSTEILKLEKEILKRSKDWAELSHKKMASGSSKDEEMNYIG